ncbi:NlpC/P60 family protein [Streptomyces sp. 4N509B]|uniref:NlpC/P60 family protein n=1 Tax=Streptomyces sp. 4N509B TaxID=3457413 RepID=UPI003FD3C5D6
MGSHRKPRAGLLERPSARRGAVGVGAAALVSATLLTQSAYADDPDTPSIEEQRERAEEAAGRAQEVRDQVDELYHEAGVATQDFLEAEEDVEEQQDAVDEALDAAAEATEEVNEARRTLGTFAAAQYRHGGGTMPETATLLLASDPQSFFDRSHTLDRLGDQQQQALDTFSSRQADAEEHSAEATEALEELQSREDELQEQKDLVQGRLAEARELLDQLTDEEQAAYDELERLEEEEAERQRRLAEQRAQEERERELAEQREQEQAEQEEQESGGGQADGGTGSGDTYASLAEQAIAFAEAQIGKPYVWGATGPDSFDCSGLTQAAWLAAGVEIPRVTYDQVNIGTTIPRSQAQPGDLVFFYDDISHVGLYIGGGMMIHAPKPGDVVKVEAIDVMPIYSFVRPT